MKEKNHGPAHHQISDRSSRQSKFANLQAILFRMQREQAERLQALASLETIEAEMNRRRARVPRLAP
jgi:hypothetical protein